jgi:hypothetical protein
MWKKIALVQLALIIALVAYWMGKETQASTLVEPLTREFITQNQEGSVVYIWSYQAGLKEWNVTSLDFNKVARHEIDISIR